MRRSPIGQFVSLSLVLPEVFAKVNSSFPLVFKVLSWQPRSQGSFLPVPTDRERDGWRENLGTRLRLTVFYLFSSGTFGTSWTFIFYSVVCVLAVIFIYKYVPETKNRTLEQISAELSTR